MRPEEATKDKWSTAAEIGATVNLGVFSQALALACKADGRWVGKLEDPGEVDCQWRARIGDLMPSGQDIWWRMRTPEEARLAAEQIADALTRRGLPALEAVSSLAKLRAAWELGCSPYMTGTTRQRYIRLLRRIEDEPGSRV